MGVCCCGRTLRGDLKCVNHFLIFYRGSILQVLLVHLIPNGLLFSRKAVTGPRTQVIFYCSKIY
jgi:hypothetical protein